MRTLRIPATADGAATKWRRAALGEAAVPDMNDAVLIGALAQSTPKRAKLFVVVALLFFFSLVLLVVAILKFSYILSDSDY